MTEAAVRQQYNKVAARYDQRWSTYVGKTLSFLKAWAETPPLATVLDVACGTGEFERLLLAEHPTQRMTGVDISERMLEIAVQKCSAYPNASFCTAPATALPFTDHHFDMIVSANAFHYFDHPEAVLAEMKRVLKPDGKVVILDWCKDYLLCRVCDLVLQAFDPAYRGCYTQDEFHSLLTSSGFNMHRATKVRFGIVWGLMVATAAPHAGQQLAIQHNLV